MLFNNETTDDVVSILAFIDGFASDFCEEDISIDISKIESIVQGIRRDFPHKDGLDEASVFKKIANFIAYFVAERPIHHPFKNTSIPERILEINNYENAIIALLIGLSALHQSEIHQSKNVKTLTNPIELSEHSFIDLIDAISNITPQSHFKLLTVLLEQLAYKTNPDCQYQSKIFIT
jgi:hypothetical protein